MIPKKIHYCWFGRKPIPEKDQKCIASWKKYCPDYEIINMDIYHLKGTEILHYFYIKEPLFVALAKIVQAFLGKNYLAFHFVIGMLTMYFLLLAIWKNSKNIFMSIYLYISFCLFYVCMNQVRQMLAISIVLYSFYFMKRNDFKRYCIWILIAAMFHNSAIIMLPCYFICKIKFTDKVLRNYIIVTISLYIGYGIILQILSNLPYGTYITGYDHKSFELSSILNWIYRLLIFIVVIFFRKTTIEGDVNNGKLYHLAAICMVIQTLVLQNNVIARVSTYFYAFFIFLIPEVMKNLKGSRRKFVMTMGTYLVFMLVHYLYVKLYYQGTLTYQSIFDVNRISWYW